jgi:molecular chaperone HscB
MFGLPRKLRIDLENLEQRFHQLSWKLHPDNFVRASEYERNLSLERSSQLNDAYRTLRDPISRVEYLLAQEGIRKDGQNKQQAPLELLEEVFEFNETLDELRTARRAGGHQEETAPLRQRLEAVGKYFEERLSEMDAELDAAFAAWDAGVDSAAGPEERHSLMARLNDILNRRAYIANLVHRVGDELAQTQDTGRGSRDTSGSS